ncbi:MAG: monofunctional biosynthetic peptidoglycan transglycosylase, partial [Pedobacter sp.]
MAKVKRSTHKTKNTLIKKISSILSRVLLWFLMFTVLWVLIYRFVNPPITLLMIQRNIERSSDDKPSKMKKEWVDFDDISNNMKRAAVSAEDQ